MKRSALIKSMADELGLQVVDLKINTTVEPEDLIGFPLPDWAIGTTDGELVLGAQLPTKDGRRCGNAHIIGLKIPPELVTESNLQQYHVLTDAGNTMKLAADEVDELFHPPKFVSDVADINRRFAPNSSGPTDAEHELALIMNTYHLYPWCCKLASNTRGWNHDFDCKNFRQCD